MSGAVFQRQGYVSDYECSCCYLSVIVYSWRTPVTAYPQPAIPHVPKCRQPDWAFNLQRGLRRRFCTLLTQFSMSCRLSACVKAAGGYFEHRYWLRHCIGLRDSTFPDVSSDCRTGGVARATAVQAHWKHGWRSSLVFSLFKPKQKQKNLPVMKPQKSKFYIFRLLNVFVMQFSTLQIIW